MGGTVGVGGTDTAWSEPVGKEAKATTGLGSEATVVPGAQAERKTMSNKADKGKSCPGKERVVSSPALRLRSARGSSQ
jgi:hypothetical protein